MAVVKTLLAGNTSDVSATVVAQTDSPATSCRLAYTMGPEWGTEPAYLAAVVTDSAGFARFNLTGLTAGQVYRTRLELNGTLLTATTGRFRTHPAAPGERASYAMSFASCSGPVSGTTSPTNHPVYTSIKNADTLIFQHMGDLHYQNIGTNDPALFRTAYNDVIARPLAFAMYHQQAVSYIWDDHDYGPNDSSRTNAAKTAAASAYRQFFPNYPPVLSSGGIYHAYTVGRVRYVVTDQRYYRDPHNQSEATTPRTLLGAVQKQWFKDEVAAAAADPNCLFIIWVSSQVPYSDGNDYGIASWYAYNTELRELWDHFKACGAHRKMAAVCGDIHGSGVVTDFDFATEPGTSGIDLLIASPIEQNSLFTAIDMVDFRYVHVAQGQWATINVTDTEAHQELTFTSYSTLDTGEVVMNFAHTFHLGGTAPPGEYPLLRWNEDAQRWDRAAPTYRNDADTAWVEGRNFEFA